MEEEKIEETIENPVEGETTETETPIEGQETPEKPEPSNEEIVAQRDKLYARLKKEEGKRKELEAKLKKSSDVPTEDLAGLAGKMRALSGLDAIESERVIRESKMQETSLGEARKSEDFRLWRSAYRAKIEKEKMAKPSTKQPIKTVEKNWEQMNSEEQVEWIKGIKVLNPKTGKYEPTKLLPREFYVKDR